MGTNAYLFHFPTGANTLRPLFSNSQIYKRFACTIAYYIGLVVIGASKYIGLYPI